MILEKLNVKTNKDNQVEVKISTSDYVFEGIVNNKIEHLKNRQHITEYYDLDKITDYNSLWKLTKTGWKCEENPFWKKVQKPIYPFINVDGHWRRWDEQSLRHDLGIYEWTQENKDEYIYHMLSKNISSVNNNQEMEVG